MLVLWRITKLAAKNPWRMTAAWTTLLISTGFFLAVPWLIGQSIDEIRNPETDTNRLSLIGLLVIAVIAARGFFNYANLYLAESVSQRVSYRIRNLLYDKLQHLSFEFHDHEHTGNLMSKSTVDVEQVRMFVNMGLVRSGQIVSLVLGASTVMLLTDWQLGLLSLTFAPIIGARAIIVSTRMRGMWRRVQVETGHLTTVLQENLAGQRVVKAFGAEEHEERRFDHRNETVYSLTFAARRLQSSNSSLMQVIFWASTGLILWIGGNSVINETLTLGELASFFFYISLLVQPVRMVGFLVNTFARAAAAGERLFDVLDAESPVPDAPDAPRLDHVTGAVKFDNVSFRYDSRSIGTAAKDNAIEKLSLTVPAGTVIALMGAPGSGKTTLMSLLSRFYDVDSGSISIDGINIRDVALASVRSSVGIVLQDVFLFSATIRENIAYGRESATTQEIIEAAKTAQLHDEIMAFEDGYETVVGERGVTLSGGQRQRLSIARTLILDPAVLVLDDSTSSVDAGTEAQIQAAMKSVVSKRTTFIIAHRLSSIQHSDVVVLLDHGRIAEMGSPSELMASGGLFTHITELQYATALNGHAPSINSSKTSVPR